MRIVDVGRTRMLWKIIAVFVVVLFSIVSALNQIELNWIEINSIPLNVCVYVYLLFTIWKFVSAICYVFCVRLSAINFIAPTKPRLSNAHSSMMKQKRIHTNTYTPSKLQTVRMQDWWVGKAAMRKRRKRTHNFNSIKTIFAVRSFCVRNVCLEIHLMYGKHFNKLYLWKVSKSKREWGKQRKPTSFFVG